MEKKNLEKLVFINMFFNVFILVLIFLGGLLWADSNGLWERAEDIQPGVFGGDEILSPNDNFSFISPLYLYNKVYLYNKLFSSNPSFFINLTGRTQLNDLASNVLNTNSGFINGNLYVQDSLTLNQIRSCSGKLYTDSSGKVVCGVDNVNDGDNDSTNEIQTLDSVLSVGNNAGGKRIVNVANPVNSQDVATKNYVDSKLSSGSCPCGTCWRVSGFRSFSVASGNGYVASSLCTPSGWVTISYTVHVPTCFVKGTKVTLANGSLKNIEDIKVGDLVLGKDGNVNKVLKLDRVIIGKRGTYLINKKLEVTGDHPLLTTEGWKVANLSQRLFSSGYIEFNDKNPINESLLKELKVGDVLVTANGFETVQTIEHLYNRPEDEIVYNFDVDGDDTYIANGVIVHNGCQ